LSNGLKNTRNKTCIESIIKMANTGYNPLRFSVFSATASDRCHAPAPLRPPKRIRPSIPRRKQNNPKLPHSNVLCYVFITGGQKGAKSTRIFLSPPVSRRPVRPVCPVCRLAAKGLQRQVQGLLVFHPPDPESLVAGCRLLVLFPPLT